MTTTSKFIVYACPVGELNSQIEHYFSKSLESYGENAAHKYMPHCSLTGFFDAELESIPTYLEALDRAYKEAKHQQEPLDIAIKRLAFGKKWHGLELQGDRLKQLIANFAQNRTLTDYLEELRLKDWLHLSLAYGFQPEHREQLKKLATAIIDLEADVNWELRFYQKNSDWSWKCLEQWDLSQTKP